MRRRLSAGAALLPLLLGGCDPATAPGGAPSLTFESSVVFGFPTVPVSAVIQGHDLVITAIVRTPATGFEFSGAITARDSRSLTLQVDAEPTTPSFPFATQNYYKAVIRDLPRGTLDLTVVHVLHYEQTITEEQLHQTLHVP